MPAAQMLFRKIIIRTFPCILTIVFLASSAAYGATNEQLMEAIRQGQKAIDAQIGPSRSDTINAIKEIYDNQGFCGDLRKFQFFADDDSVSFRWQVLSSSGQDRSYRVRFNPADIDDFEQSRREEELLLIPKCRSGACVYFSGWDKKFTSWQIHFCDASARSRITKALNHIKQFYTPSKQLPF